jgi:hypothetical protein
MKEVKIQNLLKISPEDTIKSLQDVQKAFAETPKPYTNDQKIDSGYKMIEDALNIIRNGRI